MIIGFCCMKKEEPIKVKEETVEKKAIPVKVIDADKKALNDYINVVGISMPEKRINLSSFNGGLVEKLYFEQGNFVRKGDTLAEIDLRLNLVKLGWSFFAPWLDKLAKPSRQAQAVRKAKKKKRPLKARQAIRLVLASFP